VRGLPVWQEIMEDKVIGYDVLDVNSLMQQPGKAVCRYAGWRWLQPDTGETSTFNCNSWDCEVCRVGLSARFCESANAGEADWFVTITDVPLDSAKCRLQWQQFIRAVKGGYGKSDKYWWQFRLTAQVICDKMRLTVNEDEWAILRTRLEGGSRFEYVRVSEYGGLSGKRHFHLLVRGDWPPHIITVTLAQMFGFGYVGDVQEVYSDGAGNYLAKYLTKSGGAFGGRKVCYSRRYRGKELSDVDADWRLSALSPGIGFDAGGARVFAQRNETMRGGFSDNSGGGS